MAKFIEIKIGKRVVDLKFNLIATHPKVRAQRIEFLKEKIIFIRYSLESCLDMYVEGLGEFQIDLTGENGLPIETINGIIPTSLEDLYTKIYEAMNTE